MPADVIPLCCISGKEGRARRKLPSLRRSGNVFGHRRVWYCGILVRKTSQLLFLRSWGVTCAQVFAREICLKALFALHLDNAKRIQPSELVHAWIAPRTPYSSFKPALHAFHWRKARAVHTTNMHTAGHEGPNKLQSNRLKSPVRVTGRADTKTHSHSTARHALQPK